MLQTEFRFCRNWVCIFLAIVFCWIPTSVLAEEPFAPPTQFVIPRPIATPNIIPSNIIDTVVMQPQRLQVLAKQGGQLVVKSRFVLTNPNRLVIDIADSKLDIPTLPPAIPFLDGMLRLAQFDADTVRVVVQVSQPASLQVGFDNKSLSVAAGMPSAMPIASTPRPPVQMSIPAPVASRPPAASSHPGKNLLGRLWSHITGAEQDDDNLTATPLPPVSATKQPIASVSGKYPPLTNLEKLQQEMNGGMPDLAQRERILEIARSQLGVNKDANPEYVDNAFSRGQNENWCADFVSTILAWAGGSPWGYQSRVQNIYEWGVSQGRLTNQPAPADMVIFRYSSNGFDHIAFVESINPDNTITTIGGNEGYARAGAEGTKTSGSVARSIYSLNDKRILVFLDPLSKPLSASGSLP
jgi:hypothetical protein